MSDDHIGVKINGVLYVKLEDARKLREGWDKADERIEAQAAEITRLRAALATANTWRDTINSRLTSWMHPVLDGEEPHDALMRLLDFERRAFCDPAVSQDAADLVATARREGMEQAAQIADSCAVDWAKSAIGKYINSKWDFQSRAEAGEEIAAAIRAAAKEEQ